MVIEKTLYAPHGIVFVYDPTIDDLDVPEYVDGYTTAATDACVSVSVMHECEGEEVKFKLSDKISVIEISFIKAFSGFIETPGRKIAIVSSEDEVILEKDVKKEKTQVTVWVNDEKLATVVMVEAE